MFIVVIIIIVYPLFIIIVCILSEPHILTYLQWRIKIEEETSDSLHSNRMCHSDCKPLLTSPK